MSIENLNSFLDDKNINTGSVKVNYNAIENCLIVDDCETYDLICKLCKLSRNMVLKGLKLSKFLEFFHIFEPDNIYYSDTAYHCDSCNNYIYSDYGIHDNFYISNQDCCIYCKDCLTKDESLQDDYIQQLIDNKNECNQMLDDDMLKGHDFIQLPFEFENSMHNKKEVSKDKLDSDLKGLDYIYNKIDSNMFGITYDIWVKSKDYNKAIDVLKIKNYSYYERIATIT